ncbi:phage protein Gp36 family protein [Dysgonomonas sp.]
MAFLTKAELKTVTDINIVNKITALDDKIIEDIIDESIALMKSYLSRFYDADAIFNKEGSDRNLHIVKKLKDIVIYEVYERHTRETNAVAERRYNIAMHWLEKINTGEQGDGTLPTKPDEPDDNNTGTTGDTRYGGGTKYGSIY